MWSWFCRSCCYFERKCYGIDFRLLVLVFELATHPASGLDRLRLSEEPQPPGRLGGFFRRIHNFYPERSMILHQGFDDIQGCIDGGCGVNSPNDDGRLQWYCAPDSWGNAGGKTDKTPSREGADGMWYVQASPSSCLGGEPPPRTTTTTSQLTIYPPAKKDFWRKTYYKPKLVKDDGPFLFYALPSMSKVTDGVVENEDSGDDLYYTIETSFCLTAVCQFDQAGLMIRLDARHWLKTGIEVVDGKARLSCVVTNIYSDWSTQPWPCTKMTITTRTTSTKDTACTETSPSTENVDAVQVECQIRIHCRGTSFVVEAKHPTASGQEHEHDDSCLSTWEFLRIAHLSTHMISHGDESSSAGEDDSDGFLGPSPTEPGVMWVGVFACCPEDQRGGHATFNHFQIQSGSTFDHNADGNFEA